MSRFLKDSAKVLAITLALILTVEIVLRLAAFAWYQSEYYLFFGIHHWVGKVAVSPWSTFEGGYYKFPPNYILEGATGQGPETAKIDSHGFRGPEFESTKPKGVFRVVCLGESSTFGYHNRDDETYPFILGRLFVRDKLPVEVINAGFPYYNSGSILALFENEIVNYDPDIITIYAAYNDTSWPVQISFSGRLALWIQEHSITYALLRNVTGRLLFKAERLILDRLIPQTMSLEQFKAESELVAIRYRKDLQSIIRSARRRNIAVILIKQPMTTDSQSYRSVPYEAEYRYIQDKFEKGERLSLMEAWMVKHHRLIEELEKIAEQEKVPLVDNIKIVDQDRRRLSTWVHLTGEGNLRLAEALESVIMPYVSPPQSSTRIRPSAPSSSTARGTSAREETVR
jgi:lysophospholipase L1-like esterase